MAASGTKDPAPDNSDILKGRRNTMDSDHIYQRIKSMTNEDRVRSLQAGSSHPNSLFVQPVGPSLPPIPHPSMAHPVPRPLGIFSS